MKLQNLIRALALSLSMGLCAASAHAQSTATTDDSLFQSFGGQRGLVVLMDDFMARLLADARMNPFFKDTDQKHIKEQLVVQFCQVAGGPCKLAKPDMKKPHSGVDIAMADFNALVEVLQQSMAAQGIPFGVQNRLLAKLAPMHRDIVNVP
jgi:hemoglobin